MGWQSFLFCKVPGIRCTRKRYLVLLIIYSLLSISCKKEIEKPAPVAEDLSVSMLEKVNRLRRNGCNCGATYMPPVPPLQWNKHLELAAQHHADDMFHNNYFDHISPNGDNPIQRAEQAGYQGSYVMENIGKGYTTVDAVMVAWQHSESHCLAMMDSLHTIMGAARSGNYWVQEFGKSN